MARAAVILAAVILSDIPFGQLVAITEKAKAWIYKTFQTKKIPNDAVMSSLQTKVS